MSSTSRIAVFSSTTFRAWRSRTCSFCGPDARRSSHNVPALAPVPQGEVLWRGRELANRQSEWTVVLDQNEIDEIQRATRGVLTRQFDLTSLTPKHFPLATLGPKLKRLLPELHEGRGFALLKGLPTSSWRREEQAAAFLGLGCHLGRLRSQNASGQVLGHVRDLGLASTDPNVRIYQTHERQTFHTDSCDVVALLCLQTAMEGGLSALVSTASMYQEMRRARPELAAMLFEPIATDRRGEIPPGMKPFFMIPVLSWHAGHLSCIYQRQYIDSAQRFADAPRLSPRMVAALDMWDDLASDPRLHLTMALEPGDVQLVHNHTLLHDRTAFQDWPQPERRRHLLRLWLATPGARPLPAVFAERFGSVTVGDRGGVVVGENTPLVVPLHP